MTGWLTLTEDQRRTSIAQAAILSGITAKAIEKDWWVTLTLKALFESPYAKFFIFKGGTSLSKGWKLIKRFSEDIDIALDPAAFGKAYQAAPSHTFVKTLKKAGCTFTSTIILDALKTQFIHLGIPSAFIEIEAEPISDNIPDKDPQTLFIKYKSLYPPHDYIADQVKVEFSVRSLKDPFQPISIESILHEAFPNAAYAEIPFTILAVEPRKTLLEKAFLLHEKFLSTPVDKIKVERLSRHLYDLAKLMHTDAGQQIIKDYDFYTTLVEHRKHYIRLRGLDYNTLNPATLSFIPPENVKELFRQDYKAMLEAMIYETEPPGFDDLIHELNLLTGRFRLITEHHILEDITERAKGLITKDPDFEKEGVTASQLVTYITDIHKPAGPANKNITYKVAFIRENKEWRFLRIEIISA